MVLKQHLQKWTQGDDAGSLVAPTRAKGRQGEKMMGVRRVLLRLREWFLLHLEASLISLCWTKPIFKLGLMGIGKWEMDLEARLGYIVKFYYKN